ncbi:Hpt domain-containing protein [Trichothermofontia sp.]
MNTAPQPNAYKINWDYLHDLSGNNPEFEQEILTLFCDDTATRLQELQTALATQDLATAKAIAHHLKGSASNLCLTEMQACAIAIEGHLLHNHPDQANALLPELAQQLQHLQATVRSRFA